MTHKEKLLLLKALLYPLPKDATDEQLSACLIVARDEVMRRAYPYGYECGKEFPRKYDTLHVQIAQSIFLRRGGEGEVSHSENGVSRSWGTDGIPQSLINQIVPFAKPISRAAIRGATEEDNGSGSTNENDGDSDGNGEDAACGVMF